MEAREWRNTKDPKWGPGPWNNEPDKAQWRDEDTGLACLIVRNRMGGLCGYVGVSEGHPLFDVDYSSLDDYSAGSPHDVHGGLTFAGRCQTGPEEKTICRVAPDDGLVWWFGFDCGHSGDLLPGLAAALTPSMQRSLNEIRQGDVYRDLAYVKAECATLARNLAAAAARETR